MLELRDTLVYLLDGCKSSRDMLIKDTYSSVEEVIIPPEWLV